MTLYVNSQGAHPDNIEIEGTGGHRAGLRQNVPGVIYFANTGVRSSMFSDDHGSRVTRVHIVKFAMFFELTSAWETDCNVHSTSSRPDLLGSSMLSRPGEIT